MEVLAHMITFLSCNAKVKFQLLLDIQYQDKEGRKGKQLEIDSDTQYKISVADNDYGLITYNCRVTGYTINAGNTPAAIVNRRTKPMAVDTLTIDYSENGESNVTSINVSDIRYIEAYSTSGLDEINSKIPDFK